jgi:AcrR family transcriptional regulator
VAHIYGRDFSHSAVARLCGPRPELPQRARRVNDEEIYYDLVDAGKKTPKRRRSIRDDQRLLTRQRLQESALRIFRERGYTAATVEEISAEAGVARATFYLHFKSKSELALSITESVYPPLADRWKELDDLLVDRDGKISADLLEPWLNSIWAAHQENIVVLRMWEEMLVTEPSAPYLPTPHRNHVPRYLAAQPPWLRETAWLKLVLLTHMTAHTFILAHSSHVLRMEDEDLLKVLSEIWATALDSPGAITEGLADPRLPKA